MSANSISAESDPLLLPILHASHEDDVRNGIERVLRDHAEPIIQGIIRRRMGVSFRRASGRTQSQDEQDAEDVRGDVVAQLLFRLNAIRNVNEAIQNFKGYVAITTYRACDKHLRNKYPNRWSLKNRLRYLFTHTKGLELWESDGGEWICGFNAWRNERKPIHTGRLQELVDNPQLFKQKALVNVDPRRMSPGDLVASLMSWVNHPIELDTMVGIVSNITELKEPLKTAGPDEDNPIDLEERPDQSPDVAHQVLQRTALEQLWCQIQQLPPRQCCALLLNLRDAEGRGVLALFPIAGIAGIRQIATAMDMAVENLAELWNDLPIEDMAIATLLGVTRQQVINLRKVARERLARRMRSGEDM